MARLSCAWCCAPWLGTAWLKVRLAVAACTFTAVALTIGRTACLCLPPGQRVVFAGSTTLARCFDAGFDVLVAPAMLCLRFLLTIGYSPPLTKFNHRVAGAGAAATVGLGYERRR